MPKMLCARTAWFRGLGSAAPVAPAHAASIRARQGRPPPEEQGVNSWLAEIRYGIAELAPSRLPYPKFALA
ncbi:hypothetical protein ABTK02_20065, partial [Acinetobacter baumannii]